MTPAALSRRDLLGALALGLATAGCGTGDPTRMLSIAAGEPGGLYLEFAQLLATEIESDSSGPRVIAVPTEGSQDNLRRLAEGSVDLALALTDSAREAASRASPPAPLRAIGRVYENYLQLVVLADSPVRAVADLAGRTVSAGAQGSGAELTARRMLTVAGLGDGAAAPVTVRHHTLNDAIAALENRRIDALFWSGGVPTPALAALAGRRGIRLLSMADTLPAMRAAHDSTYDAVIVPADAYGPASEVTTIGVANLLLCRPDADPAMAATVARVLVTHAARLVPEQALGTQYLDPRSLIVTDGIALHPGAISAYRRLHG